MKEKGKSLLKWHTINSIEEVPVTAYAKDLSAKWDELSNDDFVKHIARLFPVLWRVHTFREGNTRTTVMVMTFFVEHYSYYFDQVLMSENAGYVRNAFVLASLDENSEYNHLEKILNDAICTELIDYDGILSVSETTKEKYSKYQTDDYIPTKH